MTEILETEPEVQDKPNAQPLPTPAQGRISFRDVAFHYSSNTHELVLDGITWKWNPAKPWPFWAPLAQANPRSSIWFPAFTMSPAARCW